MFENIRRIVETTPYEQIPTQNNCDQINESILLAIQQDASDIHRAHLARGTVRDDKGRTAGHYFVYIPENERESSSEPLIIDAALDQFTDENLKSGRVNASFGTKDDFGKGGKYDNPVIVSLPRSPFNHTVNEFIR